MCVLARFRNDTDRRDLISIGVATGFAAAFGAPVGGLLYSFEEASSFFTIPLMWRTLVATSLGTFVIATYHGDLSDFSVLSLGQENTESQKLALVCFTGMGWF
jgi:H+/Cl- antiporter ClcA